MYTWIVYFVIVIVYNTGLDTYDVHWKMIAYTAHVVIQLCIEYMEREQSQELSYV